MAQHHERLRRLEIWRERERERAAYPPLSPEMQAAIGPAVAAAEAAYLAAEHAGLDNAVAVEAAERAYLDHIASLNEAPDFLMALAQTDDDRRLAAEALAWER